MSAMDGLNYETDYLDFYQIYNERDSKNQSAPNLLFINFLGHLNFVLIRGEDQLLGMG